MRERGEGQGGGEGKNISQYYIIFSLKARCWQLIGSHIVSNFRFHPYYNAITILHNRMQWYFPGKVLNILIKWDINSYIGKTFPGQIFMLIILPWISHMLYDNHIELEAYSQIMGCFSLGSRVLDLSFNNLLEISKILRWNCALSSFYSCEQN